MSGKICPYCKEKVKKDAVVCKYCGKDLDPASEYCSFSPNWIFAGLTGLAVGTILALIFGYWKERGRWQDEPADFSVKDESGNKTY